MEDQEFIDGLVVRSKEAQKFLSDCTQEQLDGIVRMMAKVVFDNAELLAQLAVDETGMGVYADKVSKNKGKAKIIWNSLKGKKSVGILRFLKEEGLVEVAKPMGVVCAATPCTNPIVTPMCNAMFAVKGGNSIIVAPHPRAKKCAKAIKNLYDAELKKLGVPQDVFLVLEEPTIELTSILMRSADVVLATGGMGMVRSAYSSGKPCYGVGAGNVQCIFDRNIDIETEIPKVVTGRIFDNGIICSSEQTIIAPVDQYGRIIQEFEKNGAYYTEDPAEIEKIREAVFPNGVMNKNIVGQSVQTIAKAAGLSLPENTKLIIVRIEYPGKGEVFSKEKMCPLMSAYTYDTWEDAVEIACQNLEVEGKGHSVAIHSNSEEHIQCAGLKLPVSRVLINQICATMNGGSFFNSLSPTTTLGCGSWGNNSISENLSYKHLINVSRIAYEKSGAVQPSDAEIWG